MEMTIADGHNRPVAFPPYSLSPSELAAMLDAERAGFPFVAYKDGTGDLRLTSLKGLDRATIGRVEQSEIPLPWDAEVSRSHAQLELIGEEWTIVDDGLSRNGSFVNGERVSGRRRLCDGDAVRIGRATIVFRSPGAAGDTTVVADELALVRLTDAERRVLVALCRPLTVPGRSAIPASNTEIAAELHLSLPGVKTHVRSLFAKLQIGQFAQYRKRTELARRALEAGLVTARDLDT
jgi:pSer/pThr/pTyr-binding forkhead associated (FHA) protein/DNA-binding CsgD family transcriptional regulator